MQELFYKTNVLCFYFTSISLVNSLSWKLNAKVDYPETNMKIFKSKMDHNVTERPHVQYSTSANIGEDLITSLEIYIEKPLKIKDDQQIMSFLDQTYKQSLKLFEDLKKKIKEKRICKELKVLAKEYDVKFREFMEDNMNIDVKSTGGRDRAVLYIVETSNRMIERILNYLRTKMKKAKLRNSNPVLTNELKKKMAIDNEKMCKKFNICLTAKGFSTFLSNILNLVITSDDRKLKMFSDAISETAEHDKFSELLDKETFGFIKEGLVVFDLIPAAGLRPLYTIVRNILNNLNAPIKVAATSDKIVLKTVAFIDVVKMYDEKLLNTEENILDWHDTVQTVLEWVDGERNDINDIAFAIIRHLKKIAPHLNVDEKIKFNKLVKIIFG